MMKKCFLLLIVILASFCLFGPANKASAQAVGVGISPIRFDELVDPGQQFRGELKVTNLSDDTTILYPFLRDFKAEDEEGTPKFIVPGTEQGSFLASWIVMDTNGINFEPGEEKTVPFVVNFPPDASPGGYYGSILFGTVPPRLILEGQEKGAGMAFGQRTGCLLILQVRGDVNDEARIREFVTDKEVYGTPFKVTFITRIENIGNVHVKPRGTIKINNFFGKEVGELKVNEAAANVLPNSIRRFTSQWEGDFGFGRYTALLSLSYGVSTDIGGQGIQSIFTEAYFWIIPWRIIIPTFLGLIFIVALLALLLKLYKSKAIRKAMEQAGLGHVRYVKQYQGPSPFLHFSLVLLMALIIIFLLLLAIYFIFFA